MDQKYKKSEITSLMKSVLDKTSPQDWEIEESLKVMRYALEYKFAPETSWGKKLKNYNGEIVEWNNWGDKFWGRCIFTGEGENWLGKILTEIKGFL